ncbi:helix-turn-helix domain-containing protein [Paraburkholderia sp. MMS20-SJTN17]|uniref:Helix-turn-helix domain-containing protein n=1 Tax=Paraburkholderia translucens TaxID=2886945 RepID=A0ABS8KC93_9BURK|nr:helix-turn-helix domain-containing protein [Paraburkholderia sp. MMS20-SJTN17]MCC8402325.1 helix-turn-helix domain-containing protein [Paraburkholderia sp. MMS20-SJTN17]
MEIVPKVKSAHRVLELLEYFAETRRPATIKEISQSLGYPQSSTSVLMKSLTVSGYFDHESRTGMYAPNLRVALATAWIQDEMYSAHSLLRLMEGVLERSGHTVMIGVQQGIHVRYLHVLQATRIGRFTTSNGALRPLFHSAAGVMLLTTKTDREVGSILRKVNALERDGSLRLAIEEARKRIAQARRDGYAFSAGTSMPGAAALAMLLPTRKGDEPMTLSVGGPIGEIRRDKSLLIGTLNELVEPFRQAMMVGGADFP